MQEAIKNWLIKNAGVSPFATEEEFKQALGREIAAGRLDPNKVNAESSQRLKASVQNIVKQTVQEMQGGSMSSGNGTTPDDLFADGGNGNIRVKSASEMYRHQKNSVVNPKTGLPALTETGKQAVLPSELETAKIGVWLKHLARRSGQNLPLTEHEQNLLEDIFQKDAFCGHYQGQWVTGLEGIKVKALLNDSTSGGAEVVPVYFDEMLISYPLLYAEVFPFINLVPVPRGNMVSAGAVGNPTVNWGIEEGTPIGLFDTDDLVSGIDCSIHPVTVAIEVGRDLLQDSPADVGRQITDNVNQRMAAEMDRVVTVGNGTSEPQGVTNAPGITTVNSSNDTVGPPTFADYLALMFAIGKQYRTPAMRAFFVSNDTTYQRSRNIKVDPATPSTDQRPVLNTVNEVQNYQTLGVRHAIQQDLTNSQAIFGAFSRYRMYRRQGAETRWTQEGKELALANTMLLTVRARYGGKVIDSNAFALMSDGQSA